MSYLGVFTQCFNEETKKPPIIKDLEGLKKTLKKDYGDVFVKLMITKEFISKEYPAKIYQRFVGFKTCQECEFPNISRFGYNYSGDHDWAKLFALVSKFTESFFVLHSTKNGYFPNVLDCYQEEFVNILKAKCQKGKAQISSISFQRLKEEEIKDIEFRGDEK